MLDESDDLDLLVDLLDDDPFELTATAAVENNATSTGNQKIETSDSDLLNLTAHDLGLELSDDEDSKKEITSTGEIQHKDIKKFVTKKPQTKKCHDEAAIHSGNYKKNSDTICTQLVDPLEQELQLMEVRMKQLRDQLSKKKQLRDPSDAPKTRFTKLTGVNDAPKRTSRVLSDDESSRLMRKLKRGSDSAIHNGDTDSEDEEDQRNPLTQQFCSFGKEVSKRIAHPATAERGGNSNSVKLEKFSCIKTEDNPASKSTNFYAGNNGWKGVDGSLLAVSTPVSGFKEEKNVIVEPFSKIKLICPEISADEMIQRMAGRKMVAMSTINLHARGNDIEGDWVTIGVIVSKSNPKTSQKGSNYSIWQLSDLKDCTKTVGLFLFSSAHQALWKTTVGTVVGILNAQIMKDREGDKSSCDLLTLSVNLAAKVMNLGSSSDLGWCKGRTKQGNACRQFVNKSSCEFCVFHIQREYKKSCSGRAEIQSSFTRVDPRQALRNKVLGKDQVFYGGQMYMSPSHSQSSGSNRQTPANRGKDSARLISLKCQLKGQELQEEDHKRLMSLKHMSEGEMNAVKYVAQTNDALSEKLIAPTVGSRNFLLHMTKEESQRKCDNGEIKSLTPKELLLITKEQTAHREQLQRLRSSAALSPQLGRGVKPGGSVDLDFSPPSHFLLKPNQKLDPAKARALAIIQKKGGLIQNDPNNVCNKNKSADPKYQEKILKRLNNSTDSDETSEPNFKKSRLTSPTLESSRSTLGIVNLNSEKFKAMMEQKSRHGNLIETVEDEAMEKYYSTLEKKEMLEEKMAAVMEVPTTAVACLKCKYLASSASDLCKTENHPTKLVKATKRFFQCRKCHQRTISFDRLPRKPCTLCTEHNWERVSMGKARNGPKLDTEILSLRGDELNQINGSSNQVYLHL